MGFLSFGIGHDDSHFLRLPIACVWVCPTVDESLFQGGPFLRVLPSSRSMTPHVFAAGLGLLKLRDSLSAFRKKLFEVRVSGYPCERLKRGSFPYFWSLSEPRAIGCGGHLIERSRMSNPGCFRRELLRAGGYLNLFEDAKLERGRAVRVPRLLEKWTEMLVLGQMMSMSPFSLQKVEGASDVGFASREAG